MATRRRRVAIDLRLDVHSILCICLEPCNIDFNVKVANAMTILAILPTPAA